MTTSTNNEVMDASKEHQVKVSAIIKTLTVQRDSANNAVVNALADKAVVEDKLAETLAENEKLKQMLAQLKQESAEMRIISLNLTNRLKEAQAQIEQLQKPVTDAQIDEDQSSVNSASELQEAPAANPVLIELDPTRNENDDDWTEASTTAEPEKEKGLVRSMIEKVIPSSAKS